MPRKQEWVQCPKCKGDRDANMVAVTREDGSKAVRLCPACYGHGVVRKPKSWA